MKTKKIFKSRDYESDSGMLTSVWGPGLWHSLHAISFNYPIKPTKNDKCHYRNWIQNLKYVLPCKYCRINLVKNFKCMPLLDRHMRNRKTFSRYIYDLHELVNKMLDKKSNLSYGDVKERYEHFRARCTNENIIRNQKTRNKKTRKKENGCTDPFYGVKSKCILKIVPHETRAKTFHIDRSCKSSRRKLNIKKKMNQSHSTLV